MPDFRRFLWSLFLGTSGLRRSWAELDRFAGLSPSEARRELACRLQSQVRWYGRRADTLPEWREAARIKSPVDLWSVWPSLPILTRADLQTRFHPSRLALRGHISATGGSTGEPTPYVHDPNMIRAGQVCSTYARKKLGWEPGMPTIAIWGSERDIGHSRSLAGRISCFLRNYILVDGYTISDETVDRVVTLINRYPAVALYGFTSMLEFVAKEVLRRGIAVGPGRVKAAWNGGEMLFEHQRDVFLQAFGVPLKNLYGGRELSAMAYESGQDRALTVLRPLLLLEIVNDQGKPASPGEVGRLVFTSTVCRGTPFLRYEVGDLGTYLKEDTDESGIRRIHELHGRTAGMLDMPGGKRISSLFWNHLFKEFTEVEQFQVAFQQRRRLLVRLRGHPWSSDREAAFRAVLERLGRVEVVVQWLEKIPLTAQGKLVQVVIEDDA
jgi:phenylacetate-CoA ligase